MDITLAIRWTEILLGFAFVIQSAEHQYQANRTEKIIFSLRFLFAFLLMAGFLGPYISMALLITTFVILYYYDGPYNGGSDKMGALVLLSLTFVHWLPTQQWKEVAFGYLAIQLLLSYFISGWVKIVNPEWRNGQALINVFSYTAYPASEKIRQWAQYSKLLFTMSWAVMLFELIFPIAFLTFETLVIALFLAALFHLANAFLFGLNRFFWVWLSAYPSILWLYERLDLSLL